MRLRYLLILLTIFSGELAAENKLTLALLDGRESSLSAKILERAYAKLGIELEFAVLPAKRALYVSNKGDLDGEVNRIEGIEQAYPNLVRIPVEINRFEGMAWSQKMMPINGWSSLRGHPILIKLGIKYAEEGTRGMNVNAMSEYDKVFRALHSRPELIAVASRLEGEYRLRKLGLNNINALEPPLTSKSLFHYLHSKHTSLVPLVAESLREMGKSGELESIRDSFLRAMSN